MTVLQGLQGLRFTEDRSGIVTASIPDNWQFHYGAVKGCFEVPGKPYVVKFSFPCNVLEYCKIEYENYRKAVILGISDIVPKTRPLAIIDGITYYLQEKVEYSSETVPKRLEKQAEAAFYAVGADVVANLGEGIDDLYMMSDIWIASVIYIYGVDFFQRVKKWIIDNKINDLHGENTGYKARWTLYPMVLDFSGIDCDLEGF